MSRIHFLVALLHLKLLRHVTEPRAGIDLIFGYFQGDCVKLLEQIIKNENVALS